MATATQLTLGLLLAAVITTSAAKLLRAPPLVMSAASSGGFSWIGFEQSLIGGLARPLLVAKGTKGYAACAYIDTATADKLGEACIIFSGVNTCDDFIEADVKKVSVAAAELGCKVGMRGGDALELIR